MKYAAILIFILAGCSDPMEMTTEQIVAKMDECKKNNLHPDVYRMFGDGKVMSIQCVPEVGVKK